MKHVDIYHSEGKEVQYYGRGNSPPLMSIQGLGLTVAENIHEEAQKSEFISLEDFKKRTKASKTVVETLISHGCLKDLPESNC